MKTTNVLKTVASILILAVTTSCSKSKDAPSPNTPDSRTVKYEITGNATGTFDVSYITGSGTATVDGPTTLPWSKDIVAQTGVNNMLLNVGLSGATPGKTITSKIYVGGVVKKEQSATVQANGQAIIFGLAYTIK